MQENHSIVRIGAVVLGSWILALGASLVYSAPSLAGSPSDSNLIAADKSAVPQEAAEKGKEPMDDPCKQTVPCAVNNPPKSVDVAIDGTSCTSGIACKVPGVGCGPGASTAGRCTTIHLGSPTGKCTCSCAY